MFKLKQGFRFVNYSFFISNNLSKLSFYNELNEFSTIDEFNPSFMSISENLQSVPFSCRNYIYQSQHRFFATISSKQLGSYFSEDIAFPSHFVLLNYDLFLFSLISSYLKLKVVLEAKVWFFKIL
jgi:hypothetical protein